MNEREIIDKFKEEAKEKGYSEEEINKFIQKKFHKKRIFKKMIFILIFVFFIVLTLIFFFYTNDKYQDSRIREFKSFQISAVDNNRTVILELDIPIYQLIFERKKEIIYTYIMKGLEEIRRKTENDQIAEFSKCYEPINQSDIYILGFLEENNFICLKLTNFKEDDHCIWLQNGKEKFRKMLIKNNFLVKIFCYENLTWNENVFLDPVENKILY